MNATASDASIATEAPTGIGRMYGPISPRTNAIGRIAAITVKRREDRRVADLVDGFDGRGLDGGRSAQLEVPVDVLHDHDRVVHQDADGEDQREERDPVERVAPARSTRTA